MNQGTFMTIRQTAATGILAEHHLRLRLAQGRLPHIAAGRKILVNVPLLIEMLDRESAQAVRS